jgi:hypothetical protein
MAHHRDDWIGQVVDLSAGAEDALAKGLPGFWVAVSFNCRGVSHLAALHLDFCLADVIGLDGLGIAEWRRCSMREAPKAWLALGDEHRARSRPGEIGSRRSIRARSPRLWRLSVSVEVYTSGRTETQGVCEAGSIPW